MSGHSKWSTIKRQKGVADIKRGQTFTKIANAITVAARASSFGDHDSNPKLRVALEAARMVNMPKDNIQRAIDRGLGKLAGQTVEEVIYEGFGPGRVSFLLEGITDNRLRTNQQVKHVFEKSGGNLGGQGSVVYLFSRQGEIKLVSKDSHSEAEMLELIDLGADDVEDFIENGVQKYLVYIEPGRLSEMSNKINQSGFQVEENQVVYKPNVLTEVADPEQARKLLSLAEELEALDDIQKVYANFNVQEDFVQSI